MNGPLKSKIIFAFALNSLLMSIVPFVPLIGIGNAEVIKAFCAFGSLATSFFVIMVIPKIPDEKLDNLSFYIACILFHPPFVRIVFYNFQIKKAYEILYIRNRW